MRVEILKHKVILNVAAYDAKSKVVTVKFFGTMQKFREDEYRIVEEKTI